MQIIPTTGLKKEIEGVRERIRLVKNYSRWIQVDVCDNVFAKGKTFELELLKKLEFNTDNVLWDIHLMVKEPINWIEKCIFIGASRITGQVEMMTNREEFVKTVKDAGLEAGLAFDVETAIENIPHETDEILIMGRKAGFEARDFDKTVLDKVSYARKFEKIIGVDGGVNVDNMALLENAGANIVYSEIYYFDLINDDK